MPHRQAQLGVQPAVVNRKSFFEQDQNVLRLCRLAVK